MKDAINLIRDLIPDELLERLELQPVTASEYTEVGFSLSLMKRPKDRLANANRRVVFAEDYPTKENLYSIINMLEAASLEEYCPIWQGYIINDATRIEFVVAPAISRRVVGVFKA